MKEFGKIRELVEEKKCTNIVLLENTFVPTDMEKLSQDLSDEELEEFKMQIELSEDQKCPEIDEFIKAHQHLTYIKIDKCTNESINNVFYTLIECSKQHKKTIIDSHGHLIGESELVGKVKNTKVDDVNLKAKEDINDTTQPQETKSRKCTIF